MIKKETKRKCQGCAKIQDRSLMIKITKLSNGTLKINPSKKELGRSVYVCKNPQCVEVLIKKKRLRGGLKCTNSEEILKIEEELKNLV